MSFISIGEYQASVNDGEPINEHCVPEQTESRQMCSKPISAVFTDPQAGRAYFKRAVQPICEVRVQDKTPPGQNPPGQKPPGQKPPRTKAPPIFGRTKSLPDIIPPREEMLQVIECKLKNI